jgi:prepilin-type N-terminal cleavage/methylation domain-containing protein/prepilin-type processing-associated H-X9-DG protein
MKSRFGAFTVIELLVVMAIIALLAALLLPVLSRAKATAQGVQCASNIRQLITAWSMYYHDNEDQLPCNSDGQNGMGFFTNWVAGTMSSPQDATNSQMLVDQQESALARYVTVPEIYKCPGDRSDLVRSVSMNCRMNPTRLQGEPAFTQGGNSPYATFTRIGQIRTPSEIFVILDERSDTINDGLFGVDMSNTGTLDGSGASNPYWMIDYPASYHNGSGRLSFADGHVEAHRWLEPTTLVPLGQAHAAIHTSATDRDVQWLQNHCTYLK